MKPSIIFDFDGVLANSEIIALAELQILLQEYGIEVEMPALIEKFLGASLPQITSFVTEHTGKNVQTEFHATWYERLFTRYEQELEPVSGAIELLDWLDAENVKYCIASGSSYRRLSFALECISLTERFKDRAFSAESVCIGKPEPDIFLFAADQLGVFTNKCIVLEDSFSGTIAARRAGMPCIGFVGGGHLSTTSDSHATRLKTAGAQEVIQSHAEFRSILEPAMNK